MIRFLNQKSSMESFCTIGVDHFIKTFQLSDGSLINCYIYDTCGQERFNSIVESYYKMADAVLLVYSIASQKSFEKIKKYYVQKIEDCCKKSIPILLLGNKTDLEKEREVSQEDAINLALEEKYEFSESSCLLNKNVAGAFETLIETWNFKNIKGKTMMVPNSSKNEFGRYSIQVNPVAFDFEIIDDFKEDECNDDSKDNSFDENIIKKFGTFSKEDYEEKDQSITFRIKNLNKKKKDNEKPKCCK